MTDLSELFSALKLADAAGNTDDARKIADIIRRESAASSFKQTEKDAEPAVAPTAPVEQPKERTFGEAATDLAAGLKSGIGSVIQLPGQLYGLATGDFEDSGILGFGKRIAKSGEDMKSEALKQKEKQRSQKIQDAEDKGQWEAFKTAFGETVKDPALFASFLAEQAPQMLVPFGGAKVIKGLTLAKGLRAGLPAIEATQAAGAAGTRAAIGAGAVQQGSDIGAGAYEELYKALVLKGTPEEEAKSQALNLARAAGASGAVISLLAQRLPGAKTLEESFAGVPGTSGRLLGAAKGALGETASEIVEETGGKFAQNVAMRQVNPEQQLAQGLGATAGMAAIGGGTLGGVAGALRTPQADQAAQPPPPPPEAPQIDPDKYGAVIKGLTAAIPDSGLTDSSKLGEIFKASGIENEAEVSAYLNQAITSGEIVANSNPVFNVTDANGKVLFNTVEKAVADKAAERLNAEDAGTATVEEALATKFTKPTGMPQGIEVRAGQFKQDMFNISRGDTILNPEPLSAEDVGQKAYRLSKITAGSTEANTKEIEVLQKKIDTNNTSKEKLEAAGEALSPEYATLSAQVDENNALIQAQIDEVKQKGSAFSGDISITPAKESEEGFTLFKQGKPAEYFKTEEDLNQALAAEPTAAGITSPKPEALDAAREALREKLLPFLKKVGLENTGLRIMDSIENGQGSSDGAYAEKLISISMQAANPMGTLRHETIHALKELGAFTKQEWSILESYAKKQWVNQFLRQRKIGDSNYYDTYKKIYLETNPSIAGFDEYIIEEAIADAFKYFNATKPPANIIGNIYRKVKALLEGMGNQLSGLGFQTADDVFKRVEAGQMKPTQQAGAGAAPRYAIRNTTKGLLNPNIPLKNIKIINDVASTMELTPEEFASTSLIYQTGRAGGEQFDSEKIGGLPAVVQFLQDERRISGLPLLDIEKPEDRKILAKLMAAEALAAIRSGGANLEWYDSIVNKMLAMAGLKYPELNTDINSRVAFKIATAVTSQGLNVEDNLSFAMKVYDRFRADGKFPEIGLGKDQESMVQNFKLANNLLGDMNPNLMRQFLETEFTVEELRGAGFNIAGELGDEKVLGSSVFGPKIGFGFYSNLNGNFDPVTMDMWFMRTIGRLTGKLKTFRQDLYDAQLKKFRNELDTEGGNGLFANQFDQNDVELAKVNDKAAEALVRKVKTAHERDYKINRAFFDNGTREKSKLVAASETIVKSLDTPKDAPANGLERRNLRDVVRQMVNIVEEKYGKRVPPASLQAAIWYPEQELYKAMGVKLRVTSQSYAGAIEKILTGEGYGKPNLESAAKLGSRTAQQLAKSTVSTGIKKTGEEPIRLGSLQAGEKEALLYRGRRRVVLEEERVIPKRKRVMLEVAPDPNNKMLVKKWRSLSNEQRINISDKIANEIVKDTLTHFGLRGYVDTQVGSYLDDTNPSFALYLDSGDSVAVAKFLGHALSQDAMTVISPKASKGLDKTGAVRLNIGDVSASEVGNIYQQLREIKVNGNSPVGGQSYVNGYMVVLNYSDVPTDQLAKLIDSKLGGDYEVITEDVYTAFPEKRDYNYDNPSSDPRGNAGILRQASRDLRAKATKLLEKELKLQAGKASKFSLQDTVYIDGVNRPTTNSSGRPIFGTLEGIKNFWRGFDESKIVDKEGRPLLMYHGTTPPEDSEGIFSQFRSSDDGKMGKGIYTTSIEKYAESFAPSGAVMPLYISMNNPFYINLTSKVIEGKSARTLLREQISGESKDTFDKNYFRLDSAGSQEINNALNNEIQSITDGKRLMDMSGISIQRALKKAGYDGIVVKDSEGNFVEVNAFDSEQIKSATGNRGTFSPKSKDIRYSISDTPAFKRWFGDSKVVDKDGKPLVVYHGTKSAPSVFASSRTGSASTLFGDYEVERHGIFAAESIELAQEYANQGERPTSQTIMPLYLRIENPLDTVDGQYTDAIWNKIETAAEALGSKDTYSTARYIGDLWSRGQMWQLFDADENNDPAWNIKLFKQAGFDGLRIQERSESDVQNTAAWVAFDSTQVKSAIGNRGTFDPYNPDIRYSLRDDFITKFGQADLTNLNSKTHVREEVGFAKRLAAAISPDSRVKLRAQIVNRLEAIERQTMKVSVDPRYGGSNELLADVSATAAALQSQRASGIAAESFKRGVPVYAKGFTSVSDLNGTVKGLIPIFQPLLNKYKDPMIWQIFQFYSATRRGERFAGEGREKLFTKADFQKGRDYGIAYPEFDAVFKDYQKYNEALVKFQVDTGVLTPEMGRKWMIYSDYIPFYRQINGEETLGPKLFQNFSGVKPTPIAKGSDVKIADFLETIILNSRSAIENGMKNVASQRIARDAMRTNSPGMTDMARKLMPYEKDAADVIHVRENGIDVRYKVADILLVEAMKGLGTTEMGSVLKFMAYPTKVLRDLVTKDPGFMLANLFRDSAQAYVTSGTNMIPIIDTFKQAAKILANQSPEAKALMAAGIGGGYEFSGDVKASAKAVSAALNEKAGIKTGWQKALWPVSKVWSALEAGTTASDLATRSEIYARVMKSTNGNEAEAVYQALEVMNFGRMGSNPLIQVVSALVPFFNARVQGLDVLYRAGTGRLASASAKTQQKLFARRAMYIMGMSIAYWMLARDTDEWKRASKETRDNNWIIGSVKVPIPFEIGTIFKVLPERILEYTFGNDTGSDLADSAFRNISSTLKMVPVPQAVLPLVEAYWIDYSFFTGNGVVGRGMEKLDPQFQLREGTSLVAKKMGDITGMSPVKIDHVLQGYTGAMGMYVASAISAMIRTEDDGAKASMSLEQTPILKRFFASDKAGGSIDAFYEFKKQVDMVVATQDELQKRGNPEQYIEYMKTNGKLLGAKQIVSNIGDKLSEMRKLRNIVNFSKSMPPDQKRETLDNIRMAEIKLTESIKGIRAMVTQ